MSDQDPVCIRELREALQIQDGWLNNGMPFIDHVFDGKTGREIVRENLKRWADEIEVERRMIADITGTAELKPD